MDGLFIYSFWRWCALNPYRVLGVTPSMDIESIHNRYRQLARKYHPDGPDGDAKRFIEVNKAWKMLQSSSKVVKKPIASGGVVTHKTLFTFRRVQL